MDEESYSIAEAADMTGISAFTIRYYDKCGFFPQLRRTKGKARIFSPSDVDQIFLVDALRKSGLSIEGISYYVRLCKKGSASAKERSVIVSSQRTSLEYQLEELKESLDRLKRVENELQEEIGSA